MDRCKSSAILESTRYNVRQALGKVDGHILPAVREVTCPRCRHPTRLRHRHHVSARRPASIRLVQHCLSLLYHSVKLPLMIESESLQCVQCTMQIEHKTHTHNKGITRTHTHESCPWRSQCWRWWEQPMDRVRNCLCNALAWSRDRGVLYPFCLTSPRPPPLMLFSPQMSPDTYCAHHVYVSWSCDPLCTSPCISALPTPLEFWSFSNASGLIRGTWTHHSFVVFPPHSLQQHSQTHRVTVDMHITT